MSLFSVTAGIQRKIWSLLLMNIQTLISLAMQGLILSCMISLLNGLGAEDVLPSMENGFSKEKIGDYYTGVRRVFTKIFGDREVLAYVTDTEKGNGTKRLFFSTIFSEDLKVFCTEEEHSSSDQTDHDPVNYIRCYYMPFDGRSKSATMNRKRSGLFATIWYGVARE